MNVVILVLNKVAVFIVLVFDSLDDVAKEGADTMLLFVGRFVDCSLLRISHDGACRICDFSEASLYFELCFGRFCLGRIADLARDGLEGLFVGTEVHVGMFAHFATHGFDGGDRIDRCHYVKEF